jgi:methylase of polypeptide subunit release factors
VLRGALARAGFTTDAVAETLHTTSLSARASDVVVAERRVAGRDDAFATLVRLWLLGLPVPAGTVAAAVAPLTADDLVEAGLATRDGDEVRAAVRVVPHGDVYVVADLQSESGLSTPANYVAGVQGPSVTLANVAVRRPVRSALDVGTGCGIQALLASAHAARVVATDVNPRALEFAAAAMALNGVSNVELRLGDAFEPVAGERFDLVVANPPYVVSPDSSYVYRDSGLRGDAISRAFVQAVPQHLEEGGFGIVLVSWVLGPDEDWDAPLRAWLDGSGCDVWLLHHGTDDPLAHASKWLRPLAEEDLDAYEAALDRWLAYLDELGAAGVAYGVVVLRRRSGDEHWVRLDEFPSRVSQAGEHVLDVFAAADALAAGGDEGLLAARLALDERHTLRSQLSLTEGGGEHVLRLERGLGFELGLDEPVVALLPRLDGSADVHSVLVAAAGELGVEPDRYVTAALPVVRRLYELGFLTPA